MENYNSDSYRLKARSDLALFFKKDIDKVPIEAALAGIPSMGVGTICEALRRTLFLSGGPSGSIDEECVSVLSSLIQRGVISVFDFSSAFPYLNIDLGVLSITSKPVKEIFPGGISGSVLSRIVSDPSLPEPKADRCVMPFSGENFWSINGVTDFLSEEIWTVGGKDAFAIIDPVMLPEAVLPTQGFVSDNGVLNPILAMCPTILGNRIIRVTMLDYEDDSVSLAYYNFYYDPISKQFKLGASPYELPFGSFTNGSLIYAPGEISHSSYYIGSDLFDVISIDTVHPTEVAICYLQCPEASGVIAQTGDGYYYVHASREVVREGVGWSLNIGDMKNPLPFSEESAGTVNSRLELSNVIGSNSESPCLSSFSNVSVSVYPLSFPSTSTGELGEMAIHRDVDEFLENLVPRSSGKIKFSSLTQILRGRAVSYSLHDLNSFLCRRGWYVSRGFLHMRSPFKRRIPWSRDIFRKGFWSSDLEVTSRPLQASRISGELTRLGLLMKRYYLAPRAVLLEITDKLGLGSLFLTRLILFMGFLGENALFDRQISLSYPTPQVMDNIKAKIRSVLPPAPCPICHAEVNTTLYLHIATNHSRDGGRSVQCYFCSSSFLDPSELLKHSSSKHDCCVSRDDFDSAQFVPGGWKYRDKTRYRESCERLVKTVLENYAGTDPSFLQRTLDELCQEVCDIDDFHRVDELCEDISRARIR